LILKLSESADDPVGFWINLEDNRGCVRVSCFHARESGIAESAGTEIEMAHVEGRPHSTPDEHTTGEEDAVQMDAGKKVKKIVTRFVGKTNRAVRFNVQRIKKRLPSIEIEEHMKRIDEGVKRTNERFKRRLRKQTFRTRDSDIYKMDNPHGEGLSSLFQPAALSLISDDDEIMEIMEDEIMDDDDPTMLAENEDFSENEGFFQQCRDKLHQISRWCHDEQQREMLRSWAINFLLLENASFLLFLVPLLGFLKMNL